MIPLTDEEKELIASIDDCPWCPGTKPGFDSKLVGHRDDPDRVCIVCCPTCGASRRTLVTDAVREKAKPFTAAGYDQARALFRAMLPELVGLWNWKARQP